MPAERMIGVGLVAAVLLLSVPVDAQTGRHPSQTARGTTVIGVRIAIANGQDLALGSVRLRSSSGGLVGTISVDPSGMRSTTGALLAVDPVARPAQARFVVTGEAGQSISVAVPATVVLTRIGGDQVVTLSMTTDLGDHADELTLAAGPDGAGTLSFNVGGSMSIDTHVATGVYRGQLTATAQYN